MGGLSESEKKNKISEKLTNIYLSAKTTPESEKKFKVDIMELLTPEEKKFLEEKEIRAYYDEISSKFLKKIEEDNNNINQLRNSFNDIYDNLLKTHEEEVQKMKDVISIEYIVKQEEYEKKFENMIKGFNNRIKEIENQNKNEKEKLKKENIDLQRQLRNKIESLEQKLKEENDEEKKKACEKEIKETKEKERRKEELKNSLSKNVEKIKESKLIEIEKEFNKTKDKFCMEEISKYDKSEIKQFINSFLRSEKVPNFILDFLIQIVHQNKNIIKKIEHLNIILVGPSGVGKSTLINALLEVDIKTGFGCPQTKDSEYYGSYKIPFLRLADSRGIEKSANSGVNYTFENIKKFIKSQIDSKDYDKFVHIIWYCWTGTRFEQSELELFKKLSDQYSLNNIPVIIVYTNAVFEKEIESAKKYIKEELKLENEFIDILALEKEFNGEKVKPRNLDQLIEKSIELAKSAIKSSIFEGFIKEISEKIYEVINDVIKELKEKINSKVKIYFDEKGENITLNDFYNNIKCLILNTLYKYFILTPDDEKEFELDKIQPIIYGNKQFSFSEESMDILNKFCLNYFEKILNIYQSNLEEFLLRYSKELSQEIKIAQFEFIFNNKILSDDKLPEVNYEVLLKKDLMEKMKPKAQLAALKNSFNFIIEPLIEKIGEYFISLYQRLMKQEKFISNIIEQIKDSFSELEDKVKKYGELLQEKIKKEKEELSNENKGAAPNQSVNDDSVMKDVDNLIKDII